MWLKYIINIQIMLWVSKLDVLYQIYKYSNKSANAKTIFKRSNCSNPVENLDEEFGNDCD